MRSVVDHEMTSRAGKAAVPDARGRLGWYRSTPAHSDPYGDKAAPRAPDRIAEISHRSFLSPFSLALIGLLLLMINARCTNCEGSYIPSRVRKSTVENRLLRETSTPWLNVFQSMLISNQVGFE